MFAIESKITDLQIREKNILKILFSMNIHQVATPEMMLEDARSYVIFFRESKGRYSAYIALHLLTTDRRLYYSYSSNPFHEDKLSDVEEEAFSFAEGLGAMLDEIDFTKITDAEQDRWLDAQDIFTKKPAGDSVAQQKTVQTPPAASVAAPISDKPIQQQPAPPLQTQIVQPVPPTQPVPQQPVQQQPAPIPSQTQIVQPVPPAQPVPQQPVQQQPVPIPPQEHIAPPPKSTQKNAPSKQPQKNNKSGAGTSASKRSVQTQVTDSHAPHQASLISRDREALARLFTSF